MNLVYRLTPFRYISRQKCLLSMQTSRAHLQFVLLGILAPGCAARTWGATTGSGRQTVPLLSATCCIRIQRTVTLVDPRIIKFS